MITHNFDTEIIDNHIIHADEPERPIYLQGADPSVNRDEPANRIGAIFGALALLCGVLLMLALTGVLVAASVRLMWFLLRGVS